MCKPFYSAPIECTYSHFEHNSACPTCSKSLTENDFTELVITQASNSTDVAKTSLQALFSKHSKSNSTSKALPLSDLCYSLVRQLDVMKQSTKFLLKQLLMDSSSSNRKNIMQRRRMEYMKNEVTQIKQHFSAQRLQYEQINNDLQQKLAARESNNSELHQKIKDQQKMIEQFQRLHAGKGTGITPSSGTSDERSLHNVPPSTGNGPMNSHFHSNSVDYHQQHHNHKSPLKGFIMQKETQNGALHQGYENSRRIPGMPMGSRRRTNSASSSSGFLQSIQNPYKTRPYSGTSNDSSISNVPRIRELSSSTGFSFSGSSSSQHQSHHLNKRRRTATPGSNGSSYYGMSPNTAFTLNQGPHTIHHRRR